MKSKSANQQDQISLLNQVPRGQKGAFRYRLIHGGARKPGRRKEARPLVPRKLVHIVFKSKRAIGQYSLLRKENLRAVDEVIQKQARACFVDVRDQVNMGNHLHLKVKFRDRRSMAQFLRAVPGLIARRVMKAEKGARKGRFWDGLVFTRILATGLEEYQLKGYFHANRVERDFGRVERKVSLDEVNDWIRRLRLKSQGLPSP